MFTVVSRVVTKKSMVSPRLALIFEPYPEMASWSITVENWFQVGSPASLFSATIGLSAARAEIWYGGDVEARRAITTIARIHFSAADRPATPAVARLAAFTLRRF